MNNYLTLGLLAHVDAGKTTLAEQILFHQGSIRKVGRVDHKDAFLDTYQLERDRGITIFSKQALFTLGEKEVTLLDTPGHVDFSAEMERTLSVLDYAVLIISGADGVQGHVETIWKLLARYQVPAFLFVNKMDHPGADKEKLLNDLRKHLHNNCIDFTTEDNKFFEETAVCDDAALEAYLETGKLSLAAIAELIRDRKIFPCYFGSALRDEGIAELLDGISKYTVCPEYPQEFAAQVFKITRDPQGNRLSHLKVLGGSLRVKSVIGEEKINQIRLYSGETFTAVGEAYSGQICAVTGLSTTGAGTMLGTEKELPGPALQPVLSYQILLPPETDVHKMLKNLRELEEEDPLLHVLWVEESQEILVQVMGQIQTEILKSLIAERFHIEVGFGSGSIVYKETITEPAEGAGHFEPLRHYAEVRLLLEPGENGSGITFASVCSEDILDLNWQRLILSGLASEMQRGVLTGAELTDVKITLLTGRAHLKHTEGGDFREASRRAVRQALMKAKSVLLEPIYEYTLAVPQDAVGRAMSDIAKMSGDFSDPQMDEGMAVLTGTVPVSEAADYQQEVLTYSKGRGQFSCSVKGYAPCHNAEEVIEAVGYDPLLDAANPAGSVFCSHGAGYYVPWDEVEEHMHTQSPIQAEQRRAAQPEMKQRASGSQGDYIKGQSLDQELQSIFERTYGAGKEERSGWGAKRYSAKSTAEGRNRAQSTIDAQDEGHARSTENIRKKDHMSGSGEHRSTNDSRRKKKVEDTEEYLLVDGYNIIFAWKELNDLAHQNIDSARDRLLDILCNYQGYRKMTLIVVFDAYKRPGGGSVEKYHNIYVVYTKEAETADLYIEQAVQKIRPKRVTVATSDALEQIIIYSAGAMRMSAAELLDEVRAISKEIREEYLEKRGKIGNGLFDGLPKELVERMEEVRLGKRRFEDV